MITINDGETLELAIPAGASVTLKIQAVTTPIVTAWPFDVIIDELPTHSKPYNPSAWWTRTLADIKGITIHHTGRSTALQCANDHVGKGAPTIEYHYFVGHDGHTYQCLPLETGCWHDHTGHWNKYVAIAMAGYWHQTVPGDKILQATAWLTARVLVQLGLELDTVSGHHERAWAVSKINTACPGWHITGWKKDFFIALSDELAALGA